MLFGKESRRIKAEEATRARLKEKLVSRLLMAAIDLDRAAAERPSDPAVAQANAKVTLAQVRYLEAVSITGYASYECSAFVATLAVVDRLCREAIKLANVDQRGLSEIEGL
jgi:hypothetical protein